MAINNHPDYPQEKDRLLFTTKYIDMFLKNRESHGVNVRERMQETMAELDFQDSSQRYQDMLTNATFMDLNDQQVRHLNAVKDKPYFARMDFSRKGHQENEQLYIGKTSLYDRETQDQIIVDWRAPITNLYYEGRIGDVTYEAEGETHEGQLLLKRQYTIDQGQLEDFRDIDITTKDELLQESLSHSASSRLTDIVATIQEEQNRVIRADMRRPLIVQGVAGSGKTTIALHRVAYYIYSATNFSPENLMILAPNRLFIEYISGVLPELGVDQVVQTTFTDFALSAIQAKLTVLSPDIKLKKLIENSDQEYVELLRLLSQFKGSLLYKKMIDRYLEDIEGQFIMANTHFTVDGFILYKAHKIKRLFEYEYRYLPYYKRLDKIKRILQNQLRTKKKQILDDMEDFYDKKIEQVRNREKESENRKVSIVRLMDKRDQRMEQFKKAAKTAVKNYIGQYQKKDLLTYYQELMGDPELMARYADGEMANDDLRKISDYTTTLLGKRKIELEDLAALLYLQYELYGLKENLRIKHVVIDEAQDYSPFQFFSLRHVLETTLFTILGDLSQGIFSYRGTKNWDEIQGSIFPKANLRLLKQSYRTTVEIMNLANKIVSLADIPGTIKAEPVVRYGPKPAFHKIEGELELACSIDRLVSEMKGDGLKTFAIIGKTDEECEKIKALIDNHSNCDATLLKEDADLRNKQLVIVPSALAKGLEFDGVMIVNLSERYRNEDDMDIKLLYVAMTRPLHRLHLFAEKEEWLLLNQAAPDCFVCE